MKFCQEPSKFPHFLRSKVLLRFAMLSTKNNPTSSISQSFLAIRETTSLFIIENSWLYMLLLSLELAAVGSTTTLPLLALSDILGQRDCHLLV